MEQAKIIQKLGLVKHPEGGYFGEVYRSSTRVSVLPSPADRGLGTTPPNSTALLRTAATHIHYYLPKGAFSRFHQNRHDEIWNLYHGGPLRVWTFDERSNRLEEAVLSGKDLEFQVIVPGGVWQAAEPIERDVLVGCTVTPGWEEADEVYLTEYPESRRKLLAVRPDLERLIEAGSSD